jgi:hypothetical protein
MSVECSIRSRCVISPDNTLLCPELSLIYYNLISIRIFEKACNNIKKSDVLRSHPGAGHMAERPLVSLLS